MNNMEKYREVFADFFEVDPEDLNENFRTDSIEKWTSMMHIELMSELEDEFDIMIESEDIIEFNSYLKGIEILKKYGVAF